jgi:hypothetical protein
MPEETSLEMPMGVEQTGVDPHVLTVHFDDGECEFLTLQCNLSGSDRPCAVISCPVDHEDVDRDCIESHGAVAKDECWAVNWYENSGREGLDTQNLDPVRIPVTIEYDDGVVVHDA